MISSASLKKLILLSTFVQTNAHADTLARTDAVCHIHTHIQMDTYTGATHIHKHVQTQHAMHIRRRTRTLHIYLFQWISQVWRLGQGQSVALPTWRKSPPKKNAGRSGHWTNFLRQWALSWFTSSVTSSSRGWALNQHIISAATHYVEMQAGLWEGIHHQCYHPWAFGWLRWGI